MNQHEIAADFPYDGDPTTDLELINFLEPFIQNISDAVKRDEIINDLTDVKNTAEAHKRSS